MLVGYDQPSADERWWFIIFNVLGAVVSVAFVALISCMFLGLLTIDSLDMRIKARAAVDLDERRYAEALLPVVSQHHRLLVTLLLLNALAYEALPLFLDKLIPSWAAILLSVTFLLIFGEVIPSAIFTGPDQLRLASKLTPLVNFFMAALHPIAKPLVMVLDRLVPPEDDGDAYNRGELSALVRIQYEEREAQRARGGPGHGALGKSPAGLGRIAKAAHERMTLKDDDWRAFKREIMDAAKEKNSRSRSSSFSSVEDLPHLETPEEQVAPPLHHTEVKMVEGALTMKTKVAMDVYTPLRDIYAIPSDLVLTKDGVVDIYGQGYSRVPVYDPDPRYPNRNTAVRGVLMTRQLILIDWDDEREVSTLPLQIPPCVSPRMNLVELLQLLQRGGSLLAFVCAQPGVADKALEEGRAVPPEAGFMGLVTLEDVLECVLQGYIIDEQDMTDRNLASATLTHWAATKLQRFLKDKQIKNRGKQASATSSEGHSIGGETYSVNNDLETGPLLENGSSKGRYV